MPNWTDDNGVSHFNERQEKMPNFTDDTGSHDQFIRRNVTRAEHLAWCKKRAIEEYDFYSTIADKQRNGLVSMMSDMQKHPETGGEVVNALITMHMMKPMTRQEFVNFINGFN